MDGQSKSRATGWAVICQKNLPPGARIMSLHTVDRRAPCHSGLQKAQIGENGLSHGLDHQARANRLGRFKLVENAALSDGGYG